MIIKHHGGYRRLILRAANLDRGKTLLERELGGTGFRSSVVKLQEITPRDTSKPKGRAPGPLSPFDVQQWEVRRFP